MLNPAAPRLAHTPPLGRGGFAWRYVDLVDDTGGGVVLIWGWALPFLAPSATDAPADHPVINLVVYQGGVPVFYHLQRFDPAAVRTVPGGWRFGDNLLQSEREGDGWRVRASLDLPVAGATGRARAELELLGPAAFGHPGQGGPHAWSVLSTPAKATFHLECPGIAPIAMAGRGYHDENHCERPLTALGIREWAWGRVAEPEAERIHYAVVGNGEPVSLDVTAWPSGRLEFGPVNTFSGEGCVGGTWGFSAPQRLQVNEQALNAGKPVDESSFYLRFPLTSPRGRGWGERVRPAAIGSRWMQPMVQLCVTDPGDDGSFLLPWFSGPRATRVSRLAPWWRR